MTKHEAVDAYLAGRISRRTFIRKLAAAGVSAAAAMTYASALIPKAEARPRAQDHYPDHYGGGGGGTPPAGSSPSRPGFGGRAREREEMEAQRAREWERKRRQRRRRR